MGDADTEGVEIDGGAAVVDLTLPKVDGTLPITMAGGVNAWRIRTAAKVDVRLVAKRGGGKTVLFGDVLSGVGKNKTVIDDAAGDDRLDIDAEAGFGALTVERI
jgi:hypothetical protein